MRTDDHWNRFETISDHKMLVDGYFVGTLLKASRLQLAHRTDIDEPHP